MTMRIDDARAALAKFREFRECVLKSVEVQHFGATFCFDFDYIWSDDRGADGAAWIVADKPRQVQVTLDHVMAARFDNRLTAHTLDLPVEEHSWGLGEIALISVSDGHYSLQSGDDVGCLDVSIEWEGGRHYEIKAASLRVVQP